MTLDLSKPEHRERVQVACMMYRDDPEHFGRVVDTARRWTEAGEYVPITARACLALSSPSASAALERALLEGCGVALPHDGEDDEPGSAGEADVQADDGMLIVWLLLEGAWVRRDRRMVDVPALILRLLDATDRDSALAALREVGR